MPLHETAKLTFLDWTDLYKTEKPYQIFSATKLQDGASPTNLRFESESETKIHDVRGEVDKYSLDENGFQYCINDLSFDAFDDAEKIENYYLPEVESIIRAQVKDVGHIYFFDWRIRRNVEGLKKGEVINLSDRLQHLLPATQVHVDTAASSVANRVEKEISEHSELLLSGRVQVINVWRPIKNPIEDMPLAVCDGSSIAESDIILCDHVTGNYVAETTYLLRNNDQKWYYLNRQTPDEVLLFKNFDSSSPNVKATCAPHVSFKHANIGPTALPRESIEVRALVFSKSLPQQ